jgi:putative phosphoesterase
MRLGVVSDTHNQLRNVQRIVELFNAAGVDQVVHTGDITQAKTLEVLARLDAPLFGVYGNNDLERPALEATSASLGIDLTDPPRRLQLGGRRIAVVHDPLEFDEPLRQEHEVLLHGHTHLHVEERRAGSLVFNPGECAGWMEGRNVIGILDLEHLGIELLRF